MLAYKNFEALIAASHQARHNRKGFLLFFSINHTLYPIIYHDLFYLSRTAKLRKVFKNKEFILLFLHNSFGNATIICYLCVAKDKTYARKQTNYCCGLHPRVCRGGHHSHPFPRASQLLLFPRPYPIRTRAVGYNLLSRCKQDVCYFRIALRTELLHPA